MFGLIWYVLSMVTFIAVIFADFMATSAFLAIAMLSAIWASPDDLIAFSLSIVSLVFVPFTIIHDLDRRIVNKPTGALEDNRIYKFWPHRPEIDRPLEYVIDETEPTSFSGRNVS